MVLVRGMTVTSDGYPQIGWTIASGMWNTLRTLRDLNMETLVRIHESCKSQSKLESANIFTPTRHILQAIRRTWKTDRVHGLPVVTVPDFFPSVSKNNDTWWGSQDTKTVYLWDSMDNQDRQNTLETQDNERMDNMENKGQGMVTSTATGGLPPAPQHTQRQASGMLGIQDQGMVVERRHSNHEDQEVLRMLGENYLGVLVGH